MTKRELIQRAVSIAIQGLPGPIDRAAVEIAAEPLLPIVFGEVGRELARNERTRSLLRREKALNVVDGAVALSGDVLTEHIDDATLYDPTDTSKRYSLTTWESLTRDPLDPRLGHFAVRGEDTLRVVEPNEPFDLAGGADIALRLNIPCSPEVPAAINDPVAVPEEVIDALLAKLVVALKPVVRAR
jgi:hypothetical protein